MNFRLLLVALSVAASARYLYWRIFYSLSTFTWVEAIVSVFVLLAEIYGIAILFLGYFQTFRLKERQSIPLPGDEQLWPTVDVLVVTFDEQVKVLRRTLVGCLKMDYPSAKKRIYLLDDGRREEMRELASELGCHYIVRADNKFAKAGNLNNALRQTDGEVIAIFDADQVPVKSFLTETVGFMLADPNCALVQTPQHAFTASPFEHNLRLTGKIASEDAFFYHVAQVGNDYWNSAYFCGCCAILRRTALEKIGGIAVETVGEDAHTSMRLHAAGFNSAYYSKPLSAGLATARFGEYLGQRLRWGRGMTQIFRIQNPLFVRGLSVPQRINYFLSVLHFFGGFPRLALIFAPLANLLIGWRPVNCDNWDILFYAVPHIFFALVAMSWMSKSYRQSFWSEVFQSATAIFLIPVTFLALINPRFGKFRVTSKRLLNEHATFDLRHTWPMILMIAISLFALVFALPSRWVSRPDQHAALMINSVWAFHNAVILVAVVLAARDRVQLRSAPRINLALGCRITAPGKSEVAGKVTDLSETGARLVVPATAQLPDRVVVRIDSDFGESATLNGRVTRREKSRNGKSEVGLLFERMYRDDLHSVISLAFCAPNRWLTDRIGRDNPLRSYWYIFSSPWRAQGRGQSGTDRLDEVIPTPPRRLLNSKAAVLNRKQQQILCITDEFGVQSDQSQVPTSSLQVTGQPVPELKAYRAANSD